MKWASSLSRRPDIAEAFLEVAGEVERQLDGHPAQLLLAFLSLHHASSADRMAESAAQRFPAASTWNGASPARSATLRSGYSTAHSP